MQNETPLPTESAEVAAVRAQLASCRHSLQVYGDMIARIGQEITVASLALETLVGRQADAASVAASTDEGALL